MNVFTVIGIITVSTIVGCLVGVPVGTRLGNLVENYLDKKEKEK